MKRIHLYAVLLLCSIALIIFFPLFNSTYIYTDEAVQLWFYRKGSGFQMFTGQGRGITELLFQQLFGSITTISEVSYLRIFSLTGWILCIPAWYYVFNKTVVKEGLPQPIAFLSMVYLITMPAFAIYVSWTSVMELFIANTCGLLSGYLFYTAINYPPKKLRRPLAIAGSVLLGCISLFTYQNGFGCFLLPFLLQLIAKTRFSKKIALAVAVYFLIYLVYYLLFKLNLAVSHIPASERTNLHINIVNKIVFLFTRSLNSAFHFTYLFNEKSIPGVIVYAGLFGAWIIVSFFQKKQLLVTGRLNYFIMVFCFFGLVYLPSLIVQENYASNRTLFALDIAVFFVVAETVLTAIGDVKIKQWYAAALISSLFIGNAWYNFNKQFLSPVKKEYAQLRSFLENNYQASTDTVYFIRPQEEFFVKKYGITRSWDEFGVPSTFFEWTPEYFVRQIVFEKTGSRATAEKLVIKNWLGREAFLQSGMTPSRNTLLVDTEKIMDAP